MRISVFGLGYVGAVSSACLAALGHEVIGVDVVEEKVRRMARGESPIIEPGIDTILKAAVASSKLRATGDVSAAVQESDVSMVCVGTPSLSSGGIDTRYLQRVFRQIGSAVRGRGGGFFAVMNRSTCLPAVHNSLMATLAETSGRTLGDQVGYVCHPEFLREGTAVADFFSPPKIIFGANDERSRGLGQELYPGIEAETFNVSVATAAMAKYADNCFHALKVTFGNEIGIICKELDIDSRELMRVFCRDRKLNISDKYLTPGNPFGGSCLPKDLRALLDLSRSSALSIPMHSGILESNRQQVERIAERILGKNGRQSVGLIGLSFKEGTDDVRESPVVTIAEYLLGKGIRVRIYDSHLAFANMTGSNKNFAVEAIPHLAELLSDDLNSVVRDSQIIVVNHRLTPEHWRRAPLRPEHATFDLTGVSELRSAANYEGLYW